MKPRLPLCACVVALLAFAGCGKKEETASAAPSVSKPAGETVAIVPKSEQSAHFAAVNSHLELGGTLYGYIDVDGDFQKLAAQLGYFADEMSRNAPKAAPYLKQDYPALMSVLGIDGIKAAGLSSVPDGTGFFRNKVFIYIPDGRTGLLAALGGAPGPFQRLNLAPADADLFTEAEVDLPVVYATISKIVEMTSGKEMSGKLESMLKNAGQQAALSVLSIIQNWKGRMALVLRVDPQANFKFPGPKPLTVPAFSFLVSIDGIAPALRDALVKAPVLASRKDGDLEIFEPKMPMPVQGIKPLIAIEGSTLLIASTPEFLAECRSNGPRLSGQPEFNEALSHVGTEGNSLAYVSPRLFKRIADIRTLNPDMPAEAARNFDMVLRQLPQPDRPLVTVRKNLPDGILVESYWNRSMKQDLAMVAVYNPVTIGVLAAMAIPAFNKVRETSQEKTVLNNLRQFSGAADQFMMETGRTVATYDDLVGADKYIRELRPVAGEDYRQLRVTSQTASLSVHLASGKVVTLQR